MTKNTLSTRYDLPLIKSPASRKQLIDNEFEALCNEVSYVWPKKKMWGFLTVRSSVHMSLNPSSKKKKKH